MDRDSGRSKGFGFVTYTSSEAAAAAISAMDGKVILQMCYAIHVYSFVYICLSHFAKIV
jgi:hypothetical protein